MKRIALYIFFSLIVSIAFGQDVTFTASAPNAVVVGNQFRLTYSANADVNSNELRVDLNAFRTLAGPSTSSSSSVSIINGKMTKEVSKTFTYIMMAEKEGTFTIPAATIKHKGKHYQSNALTIKVLAEDAPQAQKTQQSSGGISSSDVFLRTTVTKRKVFQQEYLVSTVKLYTRANIGGVDNVQFPDYNGFLAYDLVKPSQINYTIENVNGKNYNTAILRQTLLYPQRSGKLSIGEAKLDAVIRIRSNRGQQDLFGDFFSTYQDVRKSLKTKAQTITVDPFPAGKPANFSGIAGNGIKINATVDNTTVKANEPITLKITLSGNGNLKLVNTPSIDFPADFETYDPKVNNNLKNTSSGVRGTRTFEYLVIPRYAGNFTIPSHSISYFDVTSKSYKTVSTPSFDLTVEKGEGEENTNVVTAFASKENVKFLGKDIRFIKTGDFKLIPLNKFLVDSTLFKLSYLIALVLFVGLLILFRTVRKNNADTVRVKHKKANKMAQKRMKIAQSLLKQDHNEKFYEEVLNALWGYLSNKLNLPSSQHNRDRVKEILRDQEVDEVLITEMNDLLDMCEFARYAPSAVTVSNQTIYDRSIELISSLDAAIKK